MGNMHSKNTWSAQNETFIERQLNVFGNLFRFVHIQQFMGISDNFYVSNWKNMLIQFSKTYCWIIQITFGKGNEPFLKYVLFFDTMVDYFLKPTKHFHHIMSWKQILWQQKCKIFNSNNFIC